MVASQIVSPTFVSDKIFSQTIADFNYEDCPGGCCNKYPKWGNFDFNEDYYGIILQYPDSDGSVIDPSKVISKAKENNISVSVISDLMSLVMIKPPGDSGADVVVGNSQRFGVPMGYGGPHAAFFATKQKYKRSIPGRIIGVSVDRHGKKAYRLALQTREQHIKRDRATSNICTAQVLLAVMAGMYAVYHGKKGIQNIANKINRLTTLLNNGLKKLGYNQENKLFFDTLKVQISSRKIQNKIQNKALESGINFRYFKSNHVGISINETTTLKCLDLMLLIIHIRKQTIKIIWIHLKIF